MENINSNPTSEDDRTPLLDGEKILGSKGWKVFKKIGIGYLIFLGICAAIAIGIIIFAITMFISIRNDMDDMRGNQQQTPNEFACATARTNLTLAEGAAEITETFYNSVSDELEGAKSSALQSWENAKRGLSEAQAEVDRVCGKE